MKFYLQKSMHLSKLSWNQKENLNTFTAIGIVYQTLQVLDFFFLWKFIFCTFVQTETSDSAGKCSLLRRPVTGLSAQLGQCQMENSVLGFIGNHDKLDKPHKWPNTYSASRNMQPNGTYKSFDW